MRKSVAMICFLALLSSSCYEAPRQGFSSEERKIIDSLYSEKMRTASSITDSLCASYREQHFDRWTDSIRAEYIAEIKNIMK